MSKVYATEIGELCAERGWSRAHLIQEVRRVAKSQGRPDLPNDASLSREIRQWISGERSLSANYADIFSTVFGVRFTSGGTADRSPKVSRRSVIAATAIISASARQSATLIERLAATVDPVAIEQFAEDADRLAVEYIAAPPAEVARDAKELRDSIAIALERTRRPSQIQELYRIAGRVSGILAYAALDIGSAPAAMSNARSALICADLAEDQHLTAWVHGTKSLIARFAQRYEDAERYLHDGMKLAPRGHTLARLASGQAQCRAHFGDVGGAQDALRKATEAQSAAGEPQNDDIGIFGFPRSKVHYYAASSLIWLPNGAGAHEAVRQANTAIQLFRTGPTTERFLTDEVLTHIYGATAYLQQGDIDAAERMLKTFF